MRVKLTILSRSVFFGSVQQLGYTRADIARLSDVSSRTVLDWERGKYTLPLVTFLKILTWCRLEQASFRYELLEDAYSKQLAGKRGGASRAKLYGPLGTTEGRLKGGQNSYIVRKDSPGNMFARKQVRYPGNSLRLAEFIGIMIGDGTMTKYQFSIALSSLVDNDYCDYVVALIIDLFGIQPTVIKRTNSNCLVILVCSVALVDFLVSKGIVLGDKIRAGLDIPTWILQKRNYSWACVRGICDTDGCIYNECHRIGEKRYCYPRLSIVSASPNLRLSLFKVLSDIGFQPKIRNSRSVQLEKTSFICQYFKVIGTSNPKHARRWAQFGEVA